MPSELLFAHANCSVSWFVHMTSELTCTHIQSAVLMLSQLIYTHAQSADFYACSVSWFVRMHSELICAPAVIVFGWSTKVTIIMLDWPSHLGMKNGTQQARRILGQLNVWHIWGTHIIPGNSSITLSPESCPVSHSMYRVLFILHQVPCSVSYIKYLACILHNWSFPVSYILYFVLYPTSFILSSILPHVSLSCILQYTSYMLSCILLQISCPVSYTMYPTCIHSTDKNSATVLQSSEHWGNNRTRLCCQ